MGPGLKLEQGGGAYDWARPGAGGQDAHNLGGDGDTPPWGGATAKPPITPPSHVPARACLRCGLPPHASSVYSPPRMQLTAEPGRRTAALLS